MPQRITVRKARWGRTGAARNWVIEDQRQNPPMLISYAAWATAIWEAHRLARSRTVAVNEHLRGITQRGPY